MGEVKESVSIRPGTEQDVPVLAQMSAEFHVEMAAIDGSDPSYDIDKAARALRRCGFCEDPLFYSLVAEVEGAPIGFALYSVGFWPDWMEGKIHLTDLYLRAGWRSRGLGRVMMEHLAEIGRARGCGLMLWSVWAKNKRASAFYERLGAKLIDDELLMEWPIEPRGRQAESSG